MEQDFSELITYLDGKFTTVDNRLNELGEQFSELQTTVDSYAKKADTYFQEMLMLAHKVDRHERWLQQIAAKLDIKLNYD
jgi:uncharacterized coiled-coil DUF342 family protein